MQRSSKIGSRLRRRVVYAVIVAAHTIWPAHALAETGQAELTIAISGIETLDGAVAIAVFDDPAEYEARENPVARTFIPVSAELLVWQVMLPAGKRYAVMAYHDVNDNGEIDLGRFGIPREPYGFSNDARSPIGPPRFAAAGFELAEQALRIRLRIR